jgi:hypothetical protein
MREGGAMKTISMILLTTMCIVMNSAEAASCFQPTSEMASLPYLGQFNYKNKVVFLLGEDHRQNDKNLKILSDVYAATKNCQVGYFMEGYVVGDPRSLFLYFGQKDHRELLYLSKVVLPIEDFKSLYLEKLLSIYLHADQSLKSDLPEGDPLAKQNAAEAFASLLIFTSKSQLAHDHLTFDVDRFDLLGEMKDRFEMLYKTYEMGYLEAFDYNDGYRKMYARYGNIMSHPYLIASDSFPVKIAVMISEKNRDYMARLKQFAAEQILSISLSYKTNPQRQVVLKDFLLNPSQAVQDRVLVNWRNEDMAANIQNFGITSSLDYMFIRVGAAHVRGLIQELNKGENKFSLVEEKIDPQYKDLVDPQP